MRQTTTKKLITSAALLGAACLLPGLAMAQVSGQCADCHTMHNSQDGATVVGSGPYGMLLTGDCVGCHTNSTNGAGRGGSSNNIPYVQHTGVPSTASGGILAGGSFYWVAAADSKGHNVAGIKAADVALGNVPPGYAAATDGFGYNSANRLTCAGTNGCHGDRSVAGDYAGLSGAHHAAPLTANKASGYMDGSGTDLANSYRFLKGVKGIESPDWESLQNLATRNVYYGVDRATQANAAATISSLCGQCHGNFHSGANSVVSGVVGATAASPWIRHPTDFDMYNVRTKEYGGYVVNMEAPVASQNISNTYARGTQSVNVADDAIVTCISCHRAHGSEHADLLRWDYSTMLAHNGTSGNVGCFQCHTAKDS
jgi:hypothetical protein